MPNDENLMLEFQRGSAEAFTELFARYRDVMYGFFRRRVENAARAEELAQEVFLAVLQGAARWEPRAPFRAYLYGIAMNLLLSERRKAVRETPGLAERDPQPPADSDAALWVREAIARLGETDREVLLLREYEQLSYEEIAVVLRVPVNTVRSRLWRARLALKELLVQRIGFEGRS
jgi:RNA polymerase sigma-70 factor (ECF subfamily)